MRMSLPFFEVLVHPGFDRPQYVEEERLQKWQCPEEGCNRGLEEHLCRNLWMKGGPREFARYWNERKVRCLKVQ